MTEFERLEQEVKDSIVAHDEARQRMNEAKKALLRAKTPKGIMSCQEDVALEIKERLDSFKSPIVRKVLKALADALDRTDIMALINLDDQMR